MAAHSRQYRLPRSHRRQMKTCTRQRAHRYRRPVASDDIGDSKGTPKKWIRTESTRRVSNAILGHTSPPAAPTGWPCGSVEVRRRSCLAVRGASHLLFLRCNAVLPYPAPVSERAPRRVSSRPTGSLLRAQSHPPSSRWTSLSHIAQHIVPPLSDAAQKARIWTAIDSCGCSTVMVQPNCRQRSRKRSPAMPHLTRIQCVWRWSVGASRARYRRP